MLKLEQALLVEGKYDAARLGNLVDGTILTTDGFRVFKEDVYKRQPEGWLRAVLFLCVG